jgi:predicted nucleic acid-binding protein
MQTRLKSDVLVLDNSVVMSWCFKDETSPYGDAVLDALAEATAFVPAIWPLEVVNVLLVAERRKWIKHAASARFVRLLSRLPIVVEHEWPERTMHDLLMLGRASDLSSYDASYIDLAMKKDCPLATVDKKMIEAAQKNDVSILAF